MDEAGWHARRAAAREASHYQHPVAGPDGSFEPVEQVPSPLADPYLDRPAARGAPPPPPKDPIRPPPPGAMQIDTHALRESWRSRATSQSSGPLTAVERSLRLPSFPRMTPHLQFMAGPMLRYDTVDPKGVWHGACMIVTADLGSVYEPYPTLQLQWDPDKRDLPQASVNDHLSLAPHPADVYPEVNSTSPQSAGKATPGPRTQKVDIPAQEIWVYQGVSSTFTFWRFMIDIPLAETEMSVGYRINGGLELEFFVPGRDQNMRIAAYSCNGFSSGVNPDDFRGPGFSNGYEPVWIDLLERHRQAPFHALVGGGDQLYCDAIVREPELQGWVNLKTPAEKKTYPITDAIRSAIDRFFFSHYCKSFRSGAFARANSSIPMLNMLDDHDLIDGFGSYPDDLQLAPIFRTIGSRGYFFFLLFQCFIAPDDDHPSESKVLKSVIIGGDGPFVPFPSHSVLTYLGPDVFMLLLDCRAERKRTQVCSPFEYQQVFERLHTIPDAVEHLIIQLGIPIAYPRMNFLESALGSKLNPLIALSKTGTIGFQSLVNKFNSDAELLDDLNDHWTAHGHKEERNWFVEQLQRIALAKRLRITFLSGDVHCAAVGLFKTLARGKARPILPIKDHRYMVNIVASAIVNTPPPPAVLSMVGFLASKTHKTMHASNETDETMMPLFTKDTNGHASKSKFIMGRRNYCTMERDDDTGELVVDIRVEVDKGMGKTVGYPVRVPPPQWG